jgi:hypothetical protein
LNNSNKIEIRHVLTTKVLPFFLQAGHATSLEPNKVPPLLLITPPRPSDSRPTTEENSSALTETVASLVARRCFDVVLKDNYCSLHMRYFSIHVCSVSIADEPAAEA